MEYVDDERGTVIPGSQRALELVTGFTAAGETTATFSTVSTTKAAPIPRCDFTVRVKFCYQERHRSSRRANTLPADRNFNSTKR